MDNLILSSATVGIVISLLAYEIGLAAQRKWKLAVLNPLLISIILVIAFLVVFHVDYESYNMSAKYLSYLLTPATVCLAIPLYLQLDLLKKNIVAILVGVFSGVLASLGTVLAMSVVFGLNHKEYVTMLPKSITTAIGMGCRADCKASGNRALNTEKLTDKFCCHISKYSCNDDHRNRNCHISAKYLSYLLTPATVCLAIPLYLQLDLLKKNIVAILVGVFSGVLASLGTVLAMSVVFGLNHKEYVTMLPKSITTAIGMGCRADCKASGNRALNTEKLTDKFCCHISKYSCNDDHRNRNCHISAKFLRYSHTDRCSNCVSGSISCGL